MKRKVTPELARLVRELRRDGAIPSAIAKRADVQVCPRTIRRIVAGLYDHLLNGQPQEPEERPEEAPLPSGSCELCGLRGYLDRGGLCVACNARADQARYRRDFAGIELPSATGAEAGPVGLDFGGDPDRERRYQEMRQAAEARAHGGIPFAPDL